MIDQQSRAASRATTSRKPFVALLAGVMLALGLLIVALPASDSGHTSWIIDENGLIEDVTAVLYVLAILLFVFKGGLRLPALRGYAIVGVLGFLLARELDMHKRFTTMGVFKIDYYQATDISWVEKGVVIGVLLLLALAVIRMLWDLDRFWAGIRAGDASMTAVALAFASAAVSKIFDGGAGKLAEIGYSVGPDVAQNFTKVEEVLEMGIAAFAIVAILSYPGLARTSGD